MKITRYDNEEAWLSARLGKITGTKAGGLVSKRDGKFKIGYYELLAERIAIPASEEAAMDRGKRLEDYAIERFIKETKKKVKNDLVIWHRDDDENIAVSPDGYIGKTEAVEVKCLSSSRHIEAWLKQEIPDEYSTQIIQYFVVNDKLKKLYFCFFDPRMPKDFFFIEVTRAQIKKEIEEYLTLEKTVLEKLKEDENKATF